MKMLWPRTLFARLMLIWIVGILLVLAISLLLFLGERDRHDADLLYEGVAREAAAAVSLLEQMPAAERERWVGTLDMRRLSMALQAPPHNIHALPEQPRLARAFKHALPDHDVNFYMQGGGYGHMMRHPEAHSASPYARMLIVITLKDGSPLLMRIAPEALPAAVTEEAPASLGRIMAALAALIAGITLLAWIAVRLATRPLQDMAAAARALGEDPNSPPLEAKGPEEVAQAAVAFNQMQQRIREHVSERTRILAAISHDLQTPITRLRLRAELIEDAEQRERVQSDLAEMQGLVREGLDYARSLDATAPLQRIDLNDLISALMQDAADMGWQVECSGRLDAPCDGQLVALRRALWNLMENGIKFGQRVSISLETRGPCQYITIRDYGPGLPDDELERVFEPFYRGEASRNRATGGTGLGLAIARNLLRAQGGEVCLSNAPSGGLVALVKLPVADLEK